MHFILYLQIQILSYNDITLGLNANTRLRKILEFKVKQFYNTTRMISSVMFHFH